MYSVYLDGNLVNDPVIGIEDFTLTLERTFDSDNIFREFSESTLTFTGDGYNYLCAQLKNDYCAKVDLQVDIYGETIFEGQIVVSFGTINFTKRTFETQIVDTSYRGLIRERIKNQIALNSLLSVGCVPITPIPTINVPMYDVNNNLVNIVEMFDVYEVFKFLIASMSDNQVAFQSTTLQTIPYAITTGWALSNNVASLPFRQFPSIAFEELYKTFRNLLALYASIEIIGGVPTIIIEREDYFFNNAASGYQLQDFAYNTEISVDESRIYSIVKIGSNDYDKDSPNNVFNNPQVEGWQERTLNTCGCVFDKDNTEDLTVDWVIDSGKIIDLLTSLDGSDEIVIVQLDSATGNTPLFLENSANNKWYYNSSLRNEIVAILWSTIFNNCIYSNRSTDNQFLTENGVSPGPDDKNFQEIAFTNACRKVPFSTTIYGRYRDTIIDTYNGVKSPNGNLACEPSVTFPIYHTTYECQNFGVYAFNASRRLVLAWPSHSFSYTITFSIIYTIDIFETSSYVNLLHTYSAGQVITANENQNNGFIDVTIQVDTPVLSLAPGNTARVSYTVVSSGLPQLLDSFIYLEGFFKSNDELVACSDITPQGNRIPYLMKFDHPICKADYDFINANRRNYLEVGGYKGWVKRLDFNPKGIGTFELLTEEIPCCDA